MAAEDTGKGQPPLHTPNKRRVWQTQPGPSSERVLEGCGGSAGFVGTRICSTAKFPRRRKAAPTRTTLTGCPVTGPDGSNGAGIQPLPSRGCCSSAGVTLNPLPVPTALLSGLLWGRRSQSPPAPIQSPGANQLELSSIPAVKQLFPQTHSLFSLHHKL